VEPTQIREIARAEYFSGANEPTITIKKNKVRFSTRCLRMLQNVDYVQFVMCSAEKRLVIEPCLPEARSAIRWSSSNMEARKPKAITCKEYYRRLRALMGWNEDCRYTVLGRMISDDSTTVIVFDLTSALIYRPVENEKISHDPEYPAEWGNGFGMSVEEQYSNPLIKRFLEDTVLCLTRTGDNEVRL